MYCEGQQVSKRELEDWREGEEEERKKKRTQPGSRTMAIKKPARAHRETAPGRSKASLWSKPQKNPGRAFHEKRPTGAIHLGPFGFPRPPRLGSKENQKGSFKPHQACKKPKPTPLCTLTMCHHHISGKLERLKRRGAIPSRESSSVCITGVAVQKGCSWRACMPFSCPPD